MSDEGASNRLQDRKWKRFLRGPDPMLLEELYVPALARAVRYDRSCAYFSSSVLAAAARGFAKLIDRMITAKDQAKNPSIRLLVNEQLEPEDVKALMEAGDTGPLEEALLKRFKTPKDILEKQRLAMLGWLAKSGRLEVRVGVMRYGTGIMHAKFGIAYDAHGDAIVFSGSGNETSHGLAGNYEQLEVSGSWQDQDRFEHYQSEFETLWKDQHDHVYTVSLPEAVKLRLIKFATAQPPQAEPTNALQRQRAYMTWKFISEACYLPNGATACDATGMVDLWPHQRSVVADAAGAWPEGRLLCDEVGMGKTLEGIVTLRRLLAGRGVKRALLLVPAGLLKQWQGELREKGGLIVPRLESQTQLVWPDDRVEKVTGLGEALRQPLLLMSRETARTEGNVPVVLAADPWDLVLLDEAHAARRARQVETEFNSANFLLELLRKLQLQGRARGVLLLSATPMQTHPWEPWDLLQVLGEGDRWLSDFGTVRRFYDAVARLKRGQCDMDLARSAATTVCGDRAFPPPPDGKPLPSPQDLAKRLAFAKASERPQFAAWLRSGAPLARRMHRNTRQTLRQYHEKGLLERPPATRKVIDVQYDFDSKVERDAYNAITGYIDRRFKELEGEKPGKGFVMTIYRRRASSSFEALRRSLERRRDGLMQVINKRAHDLVLSTGETPDWLSFDDVPDGDVKVSLALPQDPKVANKELQDIERVLGLLDTVGAIDSKRDRFFDYLKQLTEDGRSTLVFTEYTDTMEYLRNTLADHFQGRLGCYSGDGGIVWSEGDWKNVGKDAITQMLHDGKLAVLLCTDAASEGLNLQTASALIDYDLPWNPSKVEQRIGRIDRIGQAWEEILVVNLFLKDSIDQRVYGVLRSRCGLFEHFVGSMQPVLSRARRMLEASESVDLQALEVEAASVDHDDLLAETYADAETQQPDDVPPPIRRQDLVDALDLLTGECGPAAEQVGGTSSYLLSGVSPKRLTIAGSPGALDADVSAQPLTPEAPFVASILTALERPGERLPLVIASVQDDRFRSSAAVWVAPDGHVEAVDTLPEVISKLQAWDGQYPEPSAWRKAEAKAATTARTAVEAGKRTAAEREKAARARQLGAARLRLLVELGRFVLSLGGEVDDLNGKLHEVMTGASAGAQRVRTAFELLGNQYPEWDQSLLDELRRWLETQSPGSRKARQAGAELDAAIRDPRWAAQSAAAAT
jgi:superfamily II DNA or RNA helicase